MQSFLKLVFILLYISFKAKAGPDDFIKKTMTTVQSIIKDVEETTQTTLNLNSLTHNQLAQTLATGFIELIDNTFDTITIRELVGATVVAFPKRVLEQYSNKDDAETVTPEELKPILYKMLERGIHGIGIAGRWGSQQPMHLALPLVESFKRTMVFVTGDQVLDKLHEVIPDFKLSGVVLGLATFYCALAEVSGDKPAWHYKNFTVRGDFVNTKGTKSVLEQVKSNPQEDTINLYKRLAGVRLNSASGSGTNVAATITDSQELQFEVEQGTDPSSLTVSYGFAATYVKNELFLAGLTSNDRTADDIYECPLTTNPKLKVKLPQPQKSEDSAEAKEGESSGVYDDAKWKNGPFLEFRPANKNSPSPGRIPGSFLIPSPRGAGEKPSDANRNLLKESTSLRPPLSGSSQSSTGTDPDTPRTLAKAKTSRSIERPTGLIDKEIGNVIGLFSNSKEIAKKVVDSGILNTTV